MAYQLQTRGPAVIGQSGGLTPDELYGEGIWGPAVLGLNNRTGLTDDSASTFDTVDSARTLLQSLVWANPANEYRIVETELSAAEVALGIVQSL